MGTGSQKEGGKLKPTVRLTRFLFLRVFEIEAGLGAMFAGGFCYFEKKRFFEVCKKFFSPRLRLAKICAGKPWKQSGGKRTSVYHRIKGAVLYSFYSAKPEHFDANYANRRELKKGRRNGIRDDSRNSLPA
jgi:hypothetical protein